VGSLALDLAAALDPVMLAQQAGLIADEWQKQVLRSTSPRMLLNCSRQAGKSTVTSVLAVHTARYRPESLVLHISPSLRQSSELFRSCLRVYRAAGRPVESEAETLLRLELANGSRIISLPGTEGTVRGFAAPALVAVDEASRVEDELLTAVTPMLATSTQGRLLALSTPAGKRGWWYKAWEDGGDLWERVSVLAKDIPRISPEFLANERHLMTASRYRQEYECSFEEADDAVFRAEDFKAAYVGNVRELDLDVFNEWRD
jgi:hypothetical protein